MQTTERPPNVNLVKILSADLGNRYIKFLGKNGSTYRIPSFIYYLQDYQDSPEVLDNDSVFLEFADTRILVGKLAAEMGGRPTYQLDKSEVANLLLMAVIAPIPGSDLQMHIEQLRVCLPDSRDEQSVSNLKSLETTRTLTRNGKKFTYSVGQVKIFNECAAAFKYGKKHDLFIYPDKLNGVLDFGGGTLLVKLFTPSGIVIREADITVNGTFELANSIAARLLPKLGKSPDLSLIMNGIADGSCLYGATGLDFKAEFVKSHAEFLEKIKILINQQWGEKYFPELGEVLLTGGSAPLLTELASKPNSRFKLVPNHQYCNVLGMALE